MKSTSKYSSEVKERALRLVLEHQHEYEYESQWETIKSIFPKIG